MNEDKVITFAKAKKEKIPGLYFEGEFVCVVARNGNSYKLKELITKDLKACYTAATKVSGRDRAGEPIKKIDESVANSLVISRSCVEPELDDSFKVDELPGSESMLLSKAVEELYNIKNL